MVPLGVIRHSIVSTILFNIYIRIAHSSTMLHSYIDEITIFTSSTSQKIIAKHLQRNLDPVNESARKWKQ